MNTPPLHGVAFIGSAIFDKSRLAELEFKPLAELEQRFTELTATPAAKAAQRSEFEGLLANAARSIPQAKRSDFIKGARWYFEQNSAAAIDLVNTMPGNRL